MKEFYADTEYFDLSTCKASLIQVQQNFIVVVFCIIIYKYGNETFTGFVLFADLFKFAGR